jgi:hypothetical protein
MQVQSFMVSAVASHSAQLGNSIEIRTQITKVVMICYDLDLLQS